MVERAEPGTKSVPVTAPFQRGDDWPVPWIPAWGTSDRWIDHVVAKLATTLMPGVARLPERALALFLAAAARIGPLVDRRHTNAAREFLRLALGERPPEEIEARVRAAYRHFFRVMIDPERFNALVPLERTPERFDVVWTDEAREVVARHQGAILVTAHLGSWEAAMAIAPWIGFHPAYAVIRPPRNRPFSVAMQAERERRGIRLLPRRGAMRAAPRILRAGGAIALLLDHRTTGRPFLAPFFGRPARCDRSAGVLLQRFRVPVVVCACTLADEPLTYRVSFHEVLWPEDWAEADLLEITTRINRALERMILACPDQYFWLHDRYRDTPAEFPAGPGGAGERTGVQAGIVWSGRSCGPGPSSQDPVG
jgi:KDO2-lipid IV(A) lauroyltransferase